MPLPAQREPAQRTLLRDQAYNAIADAIVSGALAPDEKLNDQELAAWLGISRTPVREALARLEQQGLVTAQPGRSTVVSPIDSQAVRDAAQIASALHQLAVRDTGGRLTAAELQQMRDANRDFAAAIERGDAERALAADDRLHAVPVSASPNRLLPETLESLMPTLRRAERARFGSLLGRESVSQHDTLISALADGDIDAAVNATRLNWHTLHLDLADG